MAEQPHFVEITAESVGGLHFRVTHGPSGTTSITDAPKDNGGEASGFLATAGRIENTSTRTTKRLIKLNLQGARSPFLFLRRFPGRFFR